MSEIEETDVGQIIYDSSYNKYLKLTSNEVILNNGTTDTLKIYNNVIEGSTILLNGQINFSTVPNIYINGTLVPISTNDNLNTTLTNYATISDTNTSFNLKANISDTNTSLNLKSNISDVNTSLNLKANISDTNTSMNLKATFLMVSSSGFTTAKSNIALKYTLA